jgi:TolB-like protein
MSNLFTQLKRRNVFRVAAAYVIVGWIVLQAAELLLGIFKAPDWVSQTLAMIVLLGFPIACVFAWAFELTTEGVKRTHEVDEAESITPQTGRRLDVVILVSLVVLIGLTLWMGSEPPAPVVVSNPTTETATASAELTPETASSDPSIAVLPFLNMSDDPGQVYFSDGISEELLNVLASVDGLSVASRTSSFAFKEQVISLTEIAKKLKVGYVLEGSVRKAGDQVRITAQLIDMANDRHLWSATYDRSLADIFAVQSEIANEIAGALGDALDLQIQPVTVVPKTANLSAYDLYLKGRSAWLHRALGQDLEDAVDYLQRALELDPDFVDAKEVLAATWVTLPYWVDPEEPMEVFQARAAALAQEVLAVDPDRPLALVVLADSMEANTELGWTPMIELYERALELEPDNTTTIHWLGLLYQDLGFPERAIPFHEKCIELDPDYTNCHDQLMQALDLIGEREKARRLYEGSLLRREGLIAENNMAFAFALEMHEVASIMLRTMTRYEGAPTASLFLILENPSMDRRPFVNQWEQWAKEHDKDLTTELAIMVILGEFDRVDLSSSTGGFEYSPFMTPYRRSPQFKEYVRETGRYATWKLLGFPRWCRAVGEDDFECE